MGNPTTDRLLRLLAYFENGAASVRATLGFLAHDPTGRNGNGNGNGHATNGDMPTALAAAVVLDQKRRGHSAATKRKMSKIAKQRYAALVAGGAKAESVKVAPGYGSTAAKIERRKASADVLATFDTATPKPLVGSGRPGARLAAPLIRRGYLKKKGDGYVRTAKPFVVDPRA